MTIYVLDTSAVLAHFCMEKGYAQVQSLLDEPSSSVLVAAPALLELDGALRRVGVSPSERMRIGVLYGGTVAKVVTLDEVAVRAAIRVRDAASGRLPSMDALMSGCALAHGGILVHRDPHYETIPPTVLRTWDIVKSPECPFSPGDSHSVREARNACGSNRAKQERPRKRTSGSGGA